MRSILRACIHGTRLWHVGLFRSYTLFRSGSVEGEELSGCEGSSVVPLTTIETVVKNQSVVLDKPRAQLVRIWSPRKLSTKSWKLSNGNALKR